MKDTIFNKIPIRLYDVDTRAKSSRGIVFYHGLAFTVMSIGENIEVVRIDSFIGKIITDGKLTSQHSTSSDSICIYRILSLNST